MLPTRPAIKPMPAITGLLEQFAAHPLVALGEMHGLQEEADFITALLHHPAFPATVQVIVVEFGNARHQAVVDRFVASEPVAAWDLRPVWRDFIGWGFDHPIYEPIVAAKHLNSCGSFPALAKWTTFLVQLQCDWQRFVNLPQLLAVGEEYSILPQIRVIDFYSVQSTV